MKKNCIILLLFLLTSSCFAQSYDVKGGWIEYRYVNDNLLENVSIYSVTIHTYDAKKFAGVTLRIFDAETGVVLKNMDDNILRDTISLTNHFSGCNSSFAQNNTYKVSNIDFVLRVPIGPKSYLITASTIGRDATVININGPTYIGILYSNIILGTVNGIDYHRNSSPVLQFTDTFCVCRNMPFTFPIIASDRDGDSLSYRFGDGINASYDTTSPPLSPVQYIPPFDGNHPMGISTTIDPVTGLITGTAPDMAGGYNVTVYIDEWRNGILLNTTRKESQIKVVNCPFTKPLLKPLYSGCRRFTYTFTNEPTCPNITSWSWDFGVPNSTTDTSSLSTPTFTYPPFPGTYILKLKVANNNGYLDSATSIVKIFDSITIKIITDTSVCKTDTITLRPISDATGYVWTETGNGNTLNNYSIKTPKALPKATFTVYKVKGSLDFCSDSATIIVYASPYPKVDAGRDTAICIGEKTILNASITANIYSWSPTASLLNSYAIQPIAIPSKTTTYTLAVRDTFYCHKTVKDSVVVKVVPSFKVDAGRDALVVVGQQYQFNAKAIGNTEIVDYAWQPTNYFLNSNVSDAIAVINANTPTILTLKVTATTVVGGCKATDDVQLKVFTIAADILIPTAFSPNKDGKNDLLKPILVGMKSLDFFNVYNRSGQLIFTTSENGKGWDGTINGIVQDNGTFVVIVQGKDHEGKIVFRKTTVLLMK